MMEDGQIQDKRALELLKLDLGENPFDTARLHPDLQPYVEHNPGKGLLSVMLRHPLVFQVPFYSWKMANNQYALKKEHVDRLMAEGKTDEVLVYYERPYRMRFLLEHQDQIPIEQLRESLIWVWMDTEFPRQFGYVPVLRLFRRAGYLTDTDKRLSGMLSIFRGCTPKWRRGISWTLDAEKVGWFATRLGLKGKVYAGTVEADKILAYFVGRGEEEVVVDPKSIALK